MANSRLEINERKYKQKLTHLRHFKTFVRLLYQANDAVHVEDGVNVYVENQAALARFFEANVTRLKADLKTLELAGLIRNLQFDDNQIWFSFVKPFIWNEEKAVKHG
jgi:hypothetical protein